MSDYKKCPRCHEYGFMSRHTCPQAWEAYVVDYDEDPENPERTAYGLDAEYAALWLAEAKFYDWECPKSMEIWVREDAEHPWQKFEIDVEPVPSFTASKVEDRQFVTSSSGDPKSLVFGSCD